MSSLTEERPVKGKIALATAGLATALVLCAPACSGGGNTAERSPGDTLTERQKDSILGTLPVPGAGAIGKALEAADSARSRALQHDTIH
jgi:hypothetical protein